jgi:ribokinase
VPSPSLCAVPLTAVLGHVEWADFLSCRALPAPGEIVRVETAHEAAAGGGAMAARAFVALSGHCVLLTALGDDDRARRVPDDLGAVGVEVHAAPRSGPQPRAITWLTEDAERTIAVTGGRLEPAGTDRLPWERLAEVDAVYGTGGDAAAIRHARAARVVVATPRAGAGLIAAGIAVDALVGSARDPGEKMDDELIFACTPTHVVRTEGADGGRWVVRDGQVGRWAAAPLPGPPVDAYGCGDAFAAGLTYALGAGASIAEACAAGAAVGAATLATRAPGIGLTAPGWT